MQAARACKHSNNRDTCPECRKALCIHNRQRSICRDCKGASICPHMKRRTRCIECGGGSLCQHGRRRGKCKEVVCQQTRKVGVEKIKARGVQPSSQQWANWTWNATTMATGASASGGAALPRVENAIHKEANGKAAPRNQGDGRGRGAERTNPFTPSSSVPPTVPYFLYAVNYPEREPPKATSAFDSVSLLAHGNNFSFQQKAPEAFKVDIPSTPEPVAGGEPQLELFDASVLSNASYETDPQDLLNDMSDALTDPDSPAAVTLADSFLQIPFLMEWAACA